MLSLAAILVLSACGDDGNSTKASGKVVVDSVEDLGDCVATKLGNLVYVDTVAYVCIESVGMITWIQVSEVEDDPEDFKVCTEKKEGQYSLSPKENTLYACLGEEWISVMQLDDNDGVEESGSSEASVKGINPADVIVGSMTDSRDGQTYKTVTIGTQTWMAENLNYEGEIITNHLTEYGYCPNESDCTKYGRFYTHRAVEVVCPSGWHLPSYGEFEVLLNAVGGLLDAGKKLKSTTGWDKYYGERGNGDDAFGFSALPAGYMHLNASFGIWDYYDEGRYARFGCSSKDIDFWACAMDLYDSYDFVGLYGSNDILNDRYPVRCLKD